jgi:hypothetical protein
MAVNGHQVLMSMLISITKNEMTAMASEEIFLSL